MTFRIGLVTGILFILISIVSTISTIQTGLNAFGGIVLTAIVGLTGLGAAALARRGKAQQGSFILVATILALSLSLPFIAKGQGLALAILTIIVVSSIASNTMPSFWAIRATIASALISIAIIISDLFLPDFGIRNDPQVTYWISGIAGSIYTATILRRYTRYPLQAKLVIAFMLVTVVPISALSLYISNNTRNLLTRQSQTDLTALAQNTAASIDTYIEAQIDTIRTEAQQPSITAYLRLPDDQRANSALEALALSTLLTFERKDPIFIQSYAILDNQGRDVLDTAHEQIGQNESAYSYFTTPAASGLPYVSDLLFKSQYPTLYFTAPIRDETGEILGILRAEYNAIIFQNLLQSNRPEAGKRQLLILVDRETYLRIGYTGERSLLFKTYKEFSAEEITRLQTQQKLPPGDQASLVVGSTAFVTGLENLIQTPFFTAPSANFNTDAVTTGVPSATQNWVIVARQAEDTIYAPVEAQIRLTILATLGLTILAVMVALYVSQFITKPIVQLAQAAEQIAAGDLNVRTAITTSDEVGQLSSTFNSMTQQLQQTLFSLEQRVADRTASLQITSELNEQRARQLENIAEISRIITREQSIDKLLPLITEVVSDRFGYYHTAIFLMDENRRNAVMQAANSPGGKKLISHGHRLPIGVNSLVGYAALTGKARIALDVGADIVYFNNPFLPETHSEMALPLTARGTIIGVLDIQSTQAAAFNEDDIKTLSVLADQIATAIENARLFRQTQVALENAEEIAQTYLREEWAIVARRQANTGYLYSATGGKTLTSLVRAEDIDQAIRKGTVIKKDQATTPNSTPLLTLPIKLGDYTIGVIRVKAPKPDHDWSNEEINLLRSITERVGLALENARLVNTSQKRAAKERAIGEISAKISAASNMDTILQTAVQELGQVISGSEVVIQFDASEEE